MIEKIKMFFRGVWGSIKSWTMHFNVWLASFVVFLPEIKASLPELAAYLPPDVYKYIALVVVIGNVMLRIKTTKALTER